MTTRHSQAECIRAQGWIAAWLLATVIEELWILAAWFKSGGECRVTSGVFWPVWHKYCALYKMTAFSQVKHRKMLQLQRHVTKHDVKAKLTPEYRRKMWVAAYVCFLLLFDRYCQAARSSILCVNMRDTLKQPAGWVLVHLELSGTKCRCRRLCLLINK